MTQRWATLSVIDHINTQELITNVLLYDRLIFPVPPKGDDKEFLRWEMKGWQPELQVQRLTTLGQNSAIEVPWDENRRQIFKKKMKQLENIKFDVANKIKGIKEHSPFEMTRIILAQEQKLDISDFDIDIIAAYSSEKNLNSDFRLELDKQRSNNNIMFGQRIRVPIAVKDDPEKILTKSIELSKDRSFKKHRNKFYEWENDLIKSGIKNEGIIHKFEELNKDYNEIIDAHFKKTTLRFLFTVAGIGLGLGGALVNPMLLPGVIISSVRFLTLDRKPAIPLGETEPVAMFHDIKDALSPKPFWKRFINFF